jgi:gamma-tubulin complex component 3
MFVFEVKILILISIDNNNAIFLIYFFLFFYDRVEPLMIPITRRTRASSLSSQDKTKSQRQTRDHPSEPGSWFSDGRKALEQRAGEFLQNMGRELEEISKEYTVLLEGFLSQLPVQQHVDLKFLFFRLDFTEFYRRLHPGT